MNGFRVLVAILFGGLAVAACGNLPQPFEGAGGKGVNPLASIKESGGVDVEYVDGPAVPMARLLAQSVADDLANRGVPASTGGAGGGRFLLKGKTRTNRETDGASIVFIDWTLQDRDRRQIGSHTTEVKGTWWEWVNGDPKIIRAVGIDAGKAVAGKLQDPAETAAATAPRKGLRVEGVEGAPGDGNKTLAEALKTALKGAEVPMAEKTGDLLGSVKGVVEMSPPDKKGQQKIRITWIVQRPDGSPVGEAEQENMVPAGSLDGPWGRVASLAAGAATDGIKQIAAKLEDEALHGRPPAPPAPTAEAVTATAVPPPPVPVEAPKAPEPPAAAPEPAKPVARKAAAIEGASARPKASPAIAAGPARIQVASLKSPEAAARYWKKLQEDNPAVLAGLELNVEQADLGPEKGVFYRVQGGPFPSRAEASAACEALRKADVACLPVGR